MRAHLFSFMLLATTAMHAEPVTVIRFAKLIDGKGNVLNNPAVVVKGERVEKILTAGDALPADTKIIDLHSLTALPGLIDVHTHMTFWWDRAPGTRPWAQLG